MATTIPAPSDFRDQRKTGMGSSAQSGPLPVLLPPEVCEERRWSPNWGGLWSLPSGGSGRGLLRGSPQWGCVSAECSLMTDQK